MTYLYKLSWGELVLAKISNIFMSFLASCNFSGVAYLIFILKDYYGHFE